MTIGRFCATNVARVVTKRAAGAEGFCLRFRAEAAARVGAPDVGGAGAVEITRPKISGGAGGIAWKESGIDGGRVAVVVIEDAEKFGRRRQSPVSVVPCGDATSVGHGGLPRGFAVVHFLPHEAGDPVGDGAVGVVGVGWSVERVIRVLAKGSGAVDGLAGVGELRHAGGRHRVIGDAVAAVVVGGGRGGSGQTPCDGEGFGINTPVEAPADIVARAAHGVAHEILVGQGSPGQTLDEVTRAVGGEGNGIFEGGDGGACEG